MFLKIEMSIAKPVEEVFEAIVDPHQLCQYFTTTASSRMQEGRTIVWTWSDQNAKHEITVKEIKPNRLIAFEWAASGFETKVSIHLEQKNDKTVIKIVEDGWTKDEAGIRAYGENAQGWMHFALCLKAYLEHGINLRK